MKFSLEEWRQSRNLAVVVVTVALVLDTVLFSAVVPMLPDYLKRQQESNADEDGISSSAHNSTSYLQQGVSKLVHSPGIQNTTEGHSSNLSIKIGVLLASKTLFELISSPLFGKMTDRFGYTIIMFVGFFVTFTSTLIFAFAEQYNALLIARSFQGLGSAAIFGPGLGLLADKFPDDTERAKAISISYGGTIFGLIIGPTFGGTMYHLYGKTVPFLILAAVTLVDGCLRAFIMTPERLQREKGPTMKELLTDPYIMITLGGLFFQSFTFSTLEPLLPLWMMETMNANSAQQGLAFLPVFLTLLLALNTLNRWSSRSERYRMAILGLLLLGVCFASMPLAKTQVELILPTAFYGLGSGLVECAILPHLGYLVDLRHKSVYGTIYGLMQSSYCLAAVIGAPLGGILAANIGFEWTFFSMGIPCILYAPLLYCTRNPSRKEEQNPLIGSFEPEVSDEKGAPEWSKI